MPEVEAPLVGAEVDPSDPSGSARSIAYAIFGVGLLTMVVTYGQQFGNFAVSRVNRLTGIDGTDSNGLPIDGEL